MKRTEGHPSSQSSPTRGKEEKINLFGKKEK